MDNLGTLREFLSYQVELPTPIYPNVLAILGKYVSTKNGSTVKSAAAIITEIIAE